MNCKSQCLNICAWNNGIGTHSRYYPDTFLRMNPKHKRTYIVKTYVLLYKWLGFILFGQALMIAVSWVTWICHDGELDSLIKGRMVVDYKNTKNTVLIAVSVLTILLFSVPYF